MFQGAFALILESVGRRHQEPQSLVRSASWEVKTLWEGLQLLWG